MRVKLSLLILALLLCLQSASWPVSGQDQKLDPTAWGGNHAGRPVPEYIHGDECLFCHRNTVGATWQNNAHGVTIRQIEDASRLRPLLGERELAAVADAVEYFMGSRRRVRFLKKNGYGKFDLLSTQALFDEAGTRTGWIAQENPAWDSNKFANSCAGCHATGIDAETRTFSAFGLDCYTCHGDVTLEHTKDTSLIWLSKKKRSDARAVTSICAQCHLRGGKSRSTGLPYANNFVAGDNLFQDFAVDLSLADDEKLNPGDRHVYRNVRDVVVYGRDYPTCINCHQVHAGSHAQSITRHRLPPRSPLCFDCHNSEGDFKKTKPYTVRSELCEY